MNAILLCVVVVMLAAACSGSDGDSDDFFFALEEANGGDDPGESGGGDDGDDGGDGGDGGGGGNDGSALPNPLCPTSDIASPPSGFPFAKPPSLSAIGYDTPNAGGAGYTLRGVTMDPAPVIDELMTVVFPSATFTQTSTAVGQEAFDFVDPLGLGEYISITVNGCTNVSITLEMGAVPGDLTGDESVATASDAIGEAASVEEASEASGDAQPPGVPMVDILSVTGVFSPTPSVCIVNSTQVQIIASGDGDLAITGNATEITLEFTNPSGETQTVTEAAFGMGAGTLQWVTSTGLLIEATNCAS